MQVSGDLRTWQDGSRYAGSSSAPANAFTTEVSRSSDSVETIVVRDNAPLSTSAPRFMRLEITAP